MAAMKTSKVVADSV
jgi:hypothetical protein